jgi:hypothetical protein
METDLTDHNAFDRYAARFGWFYDNGMSYGGKSWERFERNDDSHVVVVRRGPDEVCVVRFEGATPFEIWAGAIRTTADFDRMVADTEGKLESDDTKAV